MILGVLRELAQRHLPGDCRLSLARRRGLLRLGGLVRARQLDLLIGDVHLPVGRGAVDEDDVAGQVEQVRRTVEDAGCDLPERVEEEVHRRVRCLVIEGRARGQRDTLTCPGHAGELGGRLQAALGHQREDDPLDDFPLQAPSPRRLVQGPCDPEAVPQLVQHVGATEAPGIDDLDVRALRRSDGLDRLEEAADRGDKAPQRLPVHRVRTPEVVDHLGDR